MAKTNQRMAGEIWRTYDVAKIGNDNFDDADLNHLLKQKTSNNDILRIAAASGRVDASTDQRLRKLNNESIDIRKVPMKAQAGLAKRGILDNVMYLGGDPNDDKSYAAGPSGGGKKVRAMNSPNVGGYREVETEPPTQWINNSATRDIPRGDRSEILRWDGINADGSAAALRGTRVEEDRDGSRQMLKTRDVTWRVPDDYLSSRQQARSSDSGSGPGSSTPAATAEAPAPLTERFDASKYALRTPVPSSTDTTEEARRQTRFGYTGMGGGIELGGFERYVKGLPSGLV